MLEWHISQSPNPSANQHSIAAGGHGSNHGLLEPAGKWSEVKLLSRVRLFATPWTVAYQAPLSMGFSRQEYWSGLPFPSPGDLPDLGIEPGSPAFQADPLTSEPPGKPLQPPGSLQGDRLNAPVPAACQYIYTFVKMDLGVGEVGVVETIPTLSGEKKRRVRLPLWLSWWRICLQCGRPGFDPWVGKIPWRRERLSTPIFWPGEFHGLYSP